MYGIAAKLGEQRSSSAHLDFVLQDAPQRRRLRRLLLRLWCRCRGPRSRGAALIYARPLGGVLDLHQRVVCTAGMSMRNLGGTTPVSDSTASRTADWRQKCTMLCRRQPSPPRGREL